MIELPYLLVADTVFLARTVEERYKLVSVFPHEPNDGAYRCTYDDLFRRSKIQSKYYDRLLPELLAGLGRLVPEARLDSHQLVRPVLVTLTSLFVDRGLRVLHRVRQYAGENLLVATVLPHDEFIQLDHLKSLTSTSWQLNQSIIERIAKALGLPVEAAIAPCEYPEYPPRMPQRNLLSAPPREGALRLLGKIVNRILFSIRQSPSISARFASMGFSGDDYYLSLRGFFGPVGLFKSLPPLELVTVVRNPALRRRLLQDFGPTFSRAMGELLAALSPDGIEERQRRQLCDAYAEFCVDYYPIMFLEGLSSNLRAAEACWKAAQTTFLIGANLACDEGFFYVTAAKRAGNQVIGAQHSGHYGYIEDMSVVAEFEFPLCDKMITFGWTKFERELPNTEPIPLPSPRLSEKPINGRILNDSKGTRAWKRDVLFMSNLILRFPHISTCGQARIDFIDEIHSSQKNLIAAICAADILIDHKPYNQNNVDFAENHYRDLVNIGRGRYRLLESVQKGLSPALLKGYRVVLWDQIGSGTLDCFVCKVPTMVYWERLYSRETAAAQRVVRQLEDVGVVHSSPETLVVEIRKFLADPAEWMAAEKRVKAIEAFCYQFARTDPDWSAQWRKALKALAELSAKPKQTVIRS